MSRPSEKAMSFDRVSGAEDSELEGVPAQGTPFTPVIETSEKAVAYATNAALPEAIRTRLPPYIQSLYREAYNYTWARHVMPMRGKLVVRHDQAASRAALGGG